MPPLEPPVITFIPAESTEDSAAVPVIVSGRVLNNNTDTRLVFIIRKRTTGNHLQYRYQTYCMNSPSGKKCPVWIYDPFRTSKVYSHWEKTGQIKEPGPQQEHRGQQVLASARFLVQCKSFHTVSHRPLVPKRTYFLKLPSVRESIPVGCVPPACLLPVYCSISCICLEGGDAQPLCKQTPPRMQTPNLPDADLFPSPSPAPGCRPSPWMQTPLCLPT